MGDGTGLGGRAHAPAVQPRTRRCHVPAGAEPRQEGSGALQGTAVPVEGGAGQGQCVRLVWRDVEIAPGKSPLFTPLTERATTELPHVGPARRVPEIATAV